MLHAGLDLSRGRVDVCLICVGGEIVDEWVSPPDADGLGGLARRAAMRDRSVRGVIESMNGARFVHDWLEELGWEVLIADAQEVRGLAPLACKSDRIDAGVLARLSCRDLVAAIWLPAPGIRRERELARFRLHPVGHRTTLQNRIHATLITLGHPCPVSDLFGHAGRELLDRLEFPRPWRGDVEVGLRLIDDLELQIAGLTVQLERRGADHRYIALLVTAPGWVRAIGCDGYDGIVLRIDPRSNRVVKRITVGYSPLGVAVDASAVRVTNSDDGRVSRIDRVQTAQRQMRDSGGRVAPPRQRGRRRRTHGLT